MKIYLITLTTVGFLLNSCQPQTTKVTFDFGKYIKIDNYNIQVPFSGPPNISPKRSNEYMSYVSYQYAFPHEKDDINILYGVDVIKVNYDTLIKIVQLTEQSKVEFVAGQLRLMYEKIFGGKLIDEKGVDYHGSYGYVQKIKVNVPKLREVYIQSILFPHKDLFIRMYTFTPTENEDNPKTTAFFETIKFE